MLRHKQILFSLAFATAHKQMAKEIPQHRQQVIAESHHCTFRFINGGWREHRTMRSREGFYLAIL